MSRLHFDSLMMKQQGKPDAGKPHVRFDEGEASRPCWAGTSLLYSKNWLRLAALWRSLKK